MERRLTKMSSPWTSSEIMIPPRWPLAILEALNRAPSKMGVIERSLLEYNENFVHLLSVIWDSNSNALMPAPYCFSVKIHGFAIYLSLKTVNTQIKGEEWKRNFFKKKGNTKENKSKPAIIMNSNTLRSTTCFFAGKLSRIALISLCN